MLDVFDTTIIFLCCIFRDLSFYATKAATNYDNMGINLMFFEALNQLVSTPKPGMPWKAKILMCFGKLWQICKALRKLWQIWQS